MTGERVLVTGGAGFIGSHIQDRLVAQGYKVGVIDNLSNGKKKNLNPQSTFFQADVRDRTKIEEIFETHRPTVVFHLAAQNSVPHSIENPVEDHEINVGGMINILESSKKTGVEKIIYSNTGGALFGEVEESDLPISERLSPTPISYYGLSKLCGEEYLKLYGKTNGMNWISLRYSNVYGQRQGGTSEVGVIANFIDKFLRDDTPVINGDGLHTRDYVYVGDVVEANMKALEYANSGVFHISNGLEVSNLDLFNIIASHFHLVTPPIFGSERLGDIRRSCLSNDQAKNGLSWQPTTTLDEGIEKTIQYYKEDLS